ncbi:MAG: F0F1 ATP synthase subunit delta [Gammaproteobacteria bacterium]|nr:F0F1 ATP synthase subunit delta [Gammaproteobacteria bacterium]
MAEAELTTIARPYARAVFNQALEESDGLKKWSRAMGTLAAVVADNKVSQLLDNPRLTAESEASLVLQVCGEEMDDKAGNLVRLLAENNRLALVPTIAQMYELMKAHYEKTMNVEVTSAYEVSAEEQKRLAEALHRLLQREVALQTEVDKSLIGGVIIKAEDTVIDNSVRGKLGKLSQALS